VKDTEWEEAVVEFKIKRVWNPFDENGEKKKILGPKWYENF
jgi:hypothetical protein